MSEPPEIQFLDRFTLDYNLKDTRSRYSELPILVSKFDRTSFYGNAVEMINHDTLLEWKCTQSPYCISYFYTNLSVKTIINDIDHVLKHSCIYDNPEFELNPEYQPLIGTSTTLPPQTIFKIKTPLPSQIFIVTKVKRPRKELTQTTLKDFYESISLPLELYEMYNKMIIYFWENIYHEPVFGAQKCITEFFERVKDNVESVRIQRNKVYELDEFGTLIQSDANETRGHYKHRTRAYLYLQAFYAKDQKGMEELESKLSPIKIVNSLKEPNVRYFVCKKIVAYKFTLNQVAQ